ncbi:Uncharacterised protein [Neisseria gonorrhoeae]|uniref:Uncharacterized protein n=1 Tax=Neisseria gonorrhoeae TaxID=485 RepID=A0A378VSY7_NEIGO|nr:Uncharacterised protein [Neisseria gonorrhoeae]
MMPRHNGFNVLGGIERCSQRFGQIFGNQITTGRNDGRMADGAVHINGNIGRSATNVDDAYAEVFSSSVSTACPLANG